MLGDLKKVSGADFKMRNFLSNHRSNLKWNVNRVDPLSINSLGYIPSHGNNMNSHVNNFAKEPFHFISPTSMKKYSEPSYIYKHVYVTTPNKPPDRKKKIRKYKEESWLNEMNPFSEYPSDEEIFDDD